MRKLTLSALVAVLMFGFVGVAKAERPADPGREHGHCTAFFNGQKNGHDKQKEEKGEYPGPFEALIDNAPDGSDDDDGGGTGGDDSAVSEFLNGDDDLNDDPEVAGELSDLYDWCQQFGIGGNPDENGRFTTCWTDDDEDPDTHNCDD